MRRAIAALMIAAAVGSFGPGAAASAQAATDDAPPPPTDSTDPIRASTDESDAAQENDPPAAPPADASDASTIPVPIIDHQTTVTTPPHVGRGVDPAWRESIHRIRRTHFGMQRVADVRAAGIEQLRAIHDPDGLRTMWLELRDAKSDVRDAVFEHLATERDAGPRLLAWLAMTDPDPAIRYAAVLELDDRTTPAVLDEILAGLAAADATIVNRAGELVGALGLHALTPDLIQHLIGYEPYVRNRSSSGLVSIVGGVTSPEVSPMSTAPAVYWYRTGSLLQSGGRTRWRSGWRPVEHDGVRRGLVVLARLSGDRETDHAFDQGAWWAWWQEGLRPATVREASSPPRRLRGGDA